MKKMQINSKSMVLGLITGLLIGSVGMYTYSAPQPIDAYRDDSYSFQFNGKDKVNLTGDFTTVVYKDRSYVPVRFISDNLGAKLAWDENTKTITMDVPEKIVEKIVEKVVEKPVPATSTNFKSLPQSYVDNDFRMDVTLFVRDKGSVSSRFYITIDNKSNDPWVIDTDEVVFEAKGDKYLGKDVPVGRTDNKLYNNIEGKKKVEAYLSVGNIPEDVKEGTLKVKIRRNDITQKQITMEFPVKLN